MPLRGLWSLELTPFLLILMIQSQKRKTNIVVLGSINIDTFLTVDRQPQIGETMRATSMKMGYGGKVRLSFTLMHMLGSKSGCCLLKTWCANNTFRIDWLKRFSCSSLFDMDADGRRKCLFNSTD
jgi:hypothetical protein